MSYETGEGPEVTPSARRPIARLLRDLANDMANLVRQEITLARTELIQNLKEIGKHLGQVAVGGGVAGVGLLVLVAFLVIGLGLLLGGHYWLSSLIVAVALLAGGVGMAVLGVKALGSAPIAPEKSLDRARDTQRWIGREVDGFYTSLAGSTGTGVVTQPPREIRISPRDEHGAGVSGNRSGGAHYPGSSPPKPLSVPIYKRVLHEVQDDDVTGQGAKVAFFMFTSIPPAILVLFALAGLFGGEELALFISEQMQGVLPGSADDPDTAAGFLSTYVNQVVTESAPGPLSIGLLTGLWAGSAMFVAMTEALNLAFDVSDDRSWFRRRGLAIAVMVGFLVLFLGGSLILIGGPQIAAALALGGAANLAWSIVQWPLAFLLVVLAFFLVYYVLPNRDQSPMKTVLMKSSAIAAILWLIGTVGFRIYISNFGSFSETYGFVGAVLVLLLWMYISAIVILVGGEISSEMERAA